MKTKKIPMRSCVVTKEKLEKRDLLRIVRTPEKNVIVDVTGKANGRGAYLKKDIEVINKAEKTKILDRILEIEIPASVYEEARNICK
ncbi:MAG: YlxR family protein [Firmicutes bacterium]|nr:YlxR family protein [Bacillota bacterium]